jgi:hypothetical protein
MGLVFNILFLCPFTWPQTILNAAIKQLSVNSWPDLCIDADDPVHLTSSSAVPRNRMRNHEYNYIDLKFHLRDRATSMPPLDGSGLKAGVAVCER